MESRYTEILGKIKQHVYRDTSARNDHDVVHSNRPIQTLIFALPETKNITTEQVKAPEPAASSRISAVDAPVKIIATLLALIIPCIAAFFAFTYAVSELKRDTEIQTCELAIKVGIARAINEYLEAIEKETRLEFPTELDTDDQRKRKEDAIAKIAKDKERAQKRRAHYEEAEKSLWKRNCAEIEQQALRL